MTLRVHNWKHAALAVAFLLVAALTFPDRSKNIGLPGHRYMWLLWALLAAAGTYRALKPAPEKPE